MFCPRVVCAQLGVMSDWEESEDVETSPASFPQPSWKPRGRPSPSAVRIANTSVCVRGKMAHLRVYSPSRYCIPAGVSDEGRSRSRGRGRSRGRSDQDANWRRPQGMLACSYDGSIPAILGARSLMCPSFAHHFTSLTHISNSNLGRCAGPTSGFPQN